MALFYSLIAFMSKKPAEKKSFRFSFSKGGKVIRLLNKPEIFLSGKTD